MSIEAIEYMTPDGIVIERYINGVRQEINDIDMETVPFVFERRTVTREEFDRLFKKKRK